MEMEDAKNAHHLYVVKVKDKKERLELFNFLKSYEIFCQVHYIPIHWHPFYQQLGYKKESCTVAGEFYERIISLPIYPELTAGEQQKIISIIENFYVR